MSTPPPPPGFLLDDEDDVTPPPPGFRLEKAKDDPPAPDIDNIVRAVDGDTVKLTSGNNLRLWGVDAPELRQQGWDGQGQPVPIGQQSHAALSALIADGAGRPGETVHSSYGRAVAPISVDGADVGQKMARQGNAMAAPGFLREAPERRSEYMEAERLARQNMLGLHGVYAQTPSQHRANPGYVPTRETVAQFWDTPTPFAGLRPEIEKGYLEVSRTGSAADILAYAKANGFTIDPATTEKFVTRRDGGAKVDWTIGYEGKPKPLTDSGDGRTGATIRGIGDGFLAGGLDEAGAVVDAFGLTPGRENIWNSDRRLADIWLNNQQQNSSILGYDQMAHPGWRLGGQLAGGLAIPFGAKAKTAPQLFKVGAAYGGAEGFLGTDGDVSQRAIGAVIGVPIGGAVGAAGGKLLEGAVRVAPNIAGRMRGKASGTFSRDLDEITDGSLPDPPEGFTLDDDAMAANPSPSLSQDVRQRDYLDMGPRRLNQPLSEAQRRALANGLEPEDVLPVLSNQVADIEEALARDAGRIVEAVPPDEMAALESRVVRAQTGTGLPKRGPLDMVTWLRSQGGLKDQGGELSAMGIDNAARDLDFARGEQRFGKLVDNENGMNLDDAAFRAWEAGYLPGGERPDVNAFLDAIGRTHSGSERFYHPNDLAEVAQFEGMRADRLALEERLADGPVFEDRSVPAGERAFSPVEAYEEWPAGGPDFAGNINLEKLDTPQDIKRALSQTHNRIGFDSETRGRVAHAETERLAAELNMTPDKLLSRRNGEAFNAEEALAARQILAKSGNELVNAAKRVQALDDPGDELLADFRQKWTRHVAIQEQVAGMTAEAGRTLQQFRMAADSRMVKGDVLSSIVGSGGGKAGLKDAANVLIDAAEESPGHFNTMSDKLSRPGLKDMGVELWYNWLLSGPQTHAVNIASNTLTAIAQIPEHGIASAIGRARQVFPGADIDRITGSEIGARAFGLLQGAKEGLTHAGRSFRTGEPSDFITKVEAQSHKAIPGVAGGILRVPTRALMAEDEFFKAIARRMELSGLAVRQASKEGLKGETAKRRIAELVADPTDEMLRSSLDYGRYLTFQRPLGDLGSLATTATQKAPWLKLFVPFVRTPVNLLKFATERSPAAPLLKEWRADFNAGGAKRDLAVAKALVGTGVGMSVYQAALEGRISGQAPSDKSRRALQYADGWKPYSIRVGDKWISFQRLDPFSTTLGIAADLATLGDGLTEAQRENQATLLVASIAGNLASKTWLSGLSELLGAINEPEMNADRFVKRMAGSIAVPTGIAQVARTVDPILRETETVGEYVQSRIPGLSRSLPPRRDVWGRQIENEGGIGPDIVSPLWQSSARNDPVNREMAAIDYAPGKPGRTVRGRDLTPEQHDAYQAAVGDAAHKVLKRLIATPKWRGLDKEDRRDAAIKAVRKARDGVKDRLFGAKSPKLRPNQRNVPPPPAGFSLDGEAAGRNVYRDLTNTIPGVRFTSGFRTPEYQAQMRRRGYKPATNSAHLDGSALDMLPPQGKSLDWLKKQVRKYDPEARLDIHDGHLHATFPGYYGAPVLGGAKGAGLKNPLANMPPPPPGFVMDAQ